MKTLFNKLMTEHGRSIFLFLTVGSFATFINLLVFTLCWKIFNFNYKVAVSVAFVLAILVHFSANRYYTFQSRNAYLTKQLIRYFIIIFLDYLLTLAIVSMVVDEFHYSPYIGVFAAIFVTVCANYLLSRYWIFQRSS